MAKIIHHIESQNIALFSDFISFGMLIPLLAKNELQGFFDPIGSVLAASQELSQ